MTVYSAYVPENQRKSGAVRWQKRARLTPGERLLRNSALACAALLMLLSLRNVEHPAAQGIAGAVEKAVTADFDVDEAFGELQFVRDILPESALVFWNLTDDSLRRPVSGALVHPYSELQPWYLFAAQEGETVLCAKAGRVAEVRQSAEGEWSILMEHGDGAQSYYAKLSSCAVQEGENAEAGAAIGTAGEALYWEYCENGASVSVEGFR